MSSVSSTVGLLGGDLGELWLMKGETPQLVLQEVSPWASRNILISWWSVERPAGEGARSTQELQDVGVSDMVITTDYWILNSVSLFLCNRSIDAHDRSHVVEKELNIWNDHVTMRIV